MKSKRRHELQHNVLDAELAKIVEFFKKYSNQILWALLIVAIVVLVAVYAARRHNEKIASIVVDYDRAMTDPSLKPGDRRTLLEGLIAQDSNPRIASLSCVAIGDSYAIEALLSTAGADKATLGEQAAKYYRRAIDEFPQQKLAVMKAHLGLGKLAESRREFEQAGNEYEAVLRMPESAGMPAGLEAKASLDTLSELRSPVVMATTAPATQPAEAETQPAE